jgi:hypothetical protein
MRTTKKNRTESGNPSQIRRKTEPETNWPFIAAIHARQPTILRIPWHCPIYPLKTMKSFLILMEAVKTGLFRANH